MGVQLSTALWFKVLGSPREEFGLSRKSFSRTMTMGVIVAVQGGLARVKITSGVNSKRFGLNQ